jgi:hypothetical protein
MKRSCFYVCLMVVAFIFALSAGSLLCVEKALAQDHANNCANITATNYKTCNDCQCKIFNVIPGTDTVNSQIVQAVINCVGNWRCYTQPVQNARFDLNGDGKIDSKDSRIANKCQTCAFNPSPF